MSSPCYNYSKNDIVGFGTYGEVYLGTSKSEPPSPVAVKFARSDWDGYEDLGSEAAIMLKINGLIPHTVQLRDHYVLKGKIGILVLDRAYSSNNLADIPLNMKQKLMGVTTFSSRQVISCMKQLLECLAALKVRKILHRDIKTANLVFNQESNQLYVLDFGLACRMENHVNSNDAMTETYRAPEMFLFQEKTDFGIDLWGAGIVFFEIYTGGLLPFGFYENEVIRHILTNMGLPSDTYLKSCKAKKEVLSKLCHESFKLDWKAMILKAAKERRDEVHAEKIIDLLEKIFCYEGRISVEEALNHPLFQLDVHVKLDCEGVPKGERRGLFFSTLGLQIPLSARCIHLPMTLKREYEMQIGTVEKCLHAFKATLHPGGLIRVSKVKDTFSVELDKPSFPDRIKNGEINLSETKSDDNEFNG